MFGKRLPYIHAVRGSYVAFIVFVIMTIYIPGQGASGDIDIILTASTFLFAILGGFFLSRLNNRFNTIRELIASEDGLWLSFYMSLQSYDKGLVNRIRKMIDNYYIIVLDYDVVDYYKPTAKYFY